MNIIEVVLESEKQQTEQFLKKFDLKYEKDIIHTLNCVEDKKIIATISCSKNVIKCMAIDDAYQGLNIASTLISKMIQYIYHLGSESIFVFTKPVNKDIFLSMGFTQIVETEHTCLLEMYSDINEVLDYVKEKYNLKKSAYAAIVMNCNPMTNGHLYLIEKCSNENENVIVFVVEEDKSYFKFEERFSVVKKECEKFSNVVVVPGTQYIISSATFPTYFYKDEINTDVESIYVDLEIFKKYFMPKFNITKRYVGTEPYDKLTNSYNDLMKKCIDDLVVVERKKFNDEYISASKVRKLIMENNIEEIRNFVPCSTYKLIRER